MRSMPAIAKLYTSGMSQSEIASVMNCGQASVSRFMKRHNITPRSREVAQQLRRAKEHNCRVLDVECLNEEEPVYCLQVEDTACFSVNGVIVHNSYMPELAGKKISVRKVGARRTVKSLKFLASVFSRQPWFKDYSFSSPEEQYTLNGLDCCVTLEIARKLRGLLEAE